MNTFIKLIFQKNKKPSTLALVVLVVVLGGLLYQTNANGVWSANTLKARFNSFYINQSLKNDPDNYDLLVGLGVNHYVLKDLNKAFESYSKATVASPDEFMAWNNIGNIQRDLLDFLEAERAYKKTIEINPNYIPTYINLVDLYVIWPIDESGEKKEQQIIPLLQKGLKANPKDTQLQETLKAYINANK